MKSTRLADLFYNLNINPFYLIAPSPFILFSILYIMFYFLFEFTLLISIGFSLGVVILAFLIFYIYFHRDPDRETTDDSNKILAPADGCIDYVKKIKKGKVIKSKKNGREFELNELMNTDGYSNSDGYIIGIEMRLLDVHITRSPISGDKESEIHTRGKIVSMSDPMFEVKNERDTIIIENSDGFKIGVVQIASVLARTIDSFIEDKTTLEIGERLGLIRFGSQVDTVIFSEEIEIKVEEGDRAYAGVTELAEIKNHEDRH